ncbi:MAG: hypothetical protein WEC33_02040 [Dehalococcoidia bacterium]
MTAEILPIPVALCFDVEPDELEVALEPRPWLGFERLLDRIDRLRREVEIASGRPATFSWFLRMDPQIATSHGDAAWVVQRYGDALDSLRAAGDTIGIHPHAWRWSDRSRRWIVDHGDLDWVEHCLRLSIDTYRRTMGESCQAMRFGDRFTDARIVQLAAALGIRYDVTLEPGSHGARSPRPGTVATGRIPSQTMAPREPYRPAPDDPLRPAVPGRNAVSQDLWMIPLTALNSDPLVPVWRRLGRRLKHPLGPRHRPAPLAAPWGPVGYWRIVEAHVNASPRPYLAFAVRTDSSIDPGSSGALEAKLSALMTTQLVKRLAFTTPDAVVAAVGH